MNLFQIKKNYLKKIKKIYNKKKIKMEKILKIIKKMVKIIDDYLNIDKYIGIEKDVNNIWSLMQIRLNKNWEKEFKKWKKI